MKVLAIGDVHLPYYDQASIDLLFKVMDYYRPDVTVQVGDMLDGYLLSRFPKEQGKRIATLAEEARYGRAFIRELRRRTTEHVHFTEGNHEERLLRKLDEVPELFSTHPSIQEMLQLGDDEYTPYRETWKLGKAVFCHDLGYSGMSATRQHAEALETNVFFGHLHRMEVVYSGNLVGKKRVATCCGWLGNPDRATYATAPVRSRWMHGCVVIDIDDVTGVVYSTPVPFVLGTAQVHGKVVTL